LEGRKKRPNYRKYLKQQQSYTDAIVPLGTIVKNKRLYLEMSQSEVARQADINKAIISRLENYNSCPLMITLFKICKVLNIRIKLDDKEVC